MQCNMYILSQYNTYKKINVIKQKYVILANFKISFGRIRGLIPTCIGVENFERCLAPEKKKFGHKKKKKNSSRSIKVQGRYSPAPFPSFGDFLISGVTKAGCIGYCWIFQLAIKKNRLKLRHPPLNRYSSYSIFCKYESLLKI